MSENTVDKAACEAAAREKADEAVRFMYPANRHDSSDARQMWWLVFQREFRAMAYPPLSPSLLRH